MTFMPCPNCGYQGSVGNEFHVCPAEPVYKMQPGWVLTTPLLTLREQAAIAIMAGLVGNYRGACASSPVLGNEYDGPTCAEEAATDAVQYADALIAELARSKP